MLFNSSISAIQSKQTNYDTKIGEIKNKIADHDDSTKYITTTEINKLTAESFAARLK